MQRYWQWQQSIRLSLWVLYVRSKNYNLLSMNQEKNLRGICELPHFMVSLVTQSSTNPNLSSTNPHPTPVSAVLF